MALKKMINVIATTNRCLSFMSWWTDKEYICRLNPKETPIKNCLSPSLFQIIQSKFRSNDVC